MKEEEQDSIVKRGLVQFRADEELMKGLLQASKETRIPYGVLARSWVAEKLTPAIDDIDYLRASDEYAYKEVREYLGSTTNLIEELLALHELLGELLGRSKSTLDTNQQLALLNCMQACRYQFLMGTLTCLRAHPIDQSSYRRKAIEFCAFAIKIVRSPEHAKLWLEAVNSNGKYDQYESAFKINAIITEACEIFDPRLKKMYGILSQQVHASPFAITSQVRIEYTPDGQPVHTLDYYQHQTDSKKQFLATAFLSGIEYDALIVKAFADVLISVSETFDQTSWNTALQAFQDLLKTEKANWALTIDPTGYYRQGKRPPRTK